ncbi:MAG: HD domain-containing protein [Desulfurococcaceae archaeon]
MGLLLKSIAERLADAVVNDLVSLISKSEEDYKEISAYHRVLPSNPKPYPLSGLQHFFGTAFVALRLSEFLNPDDEEKQVVSFLAGLLHDYEKIGLKREDLMKGMNTIIGEKTKLYAELLDYEDLWNDAVEVASNLESGGIRRELQNVAELVRLGDYLTGGEESWNISYVMDQIRNSLDMLGVEHYLVPVIIGKQRPVIAMIAEKLNEVLAEAGFTPLVSTPTGSLYLSKSSLTDSDVRIIYDRLAEYVSSEITKASIPTTTSKPKIANLKTIGSLINYSDKKPNTGRVISALPNLRQLSVNDIEETFRTYTTPADQALLVIWSVLVYAKTLGNVKNNLQDALRELGLKSIGGKDIQEAVINLYKYLNSINTQDLNKLVGGIKDKLIRRMMSVSVDVDDIMKVVEKTIGVGFLGKTAEESITSKEVVCLICRERISKPRILRTYLDRFKKILDINVSEVFHPDKQGRPEDYSSLEGFSSSVPICPVCEYESIVFPSTTSFFDGMWASNIVYYPAMSIDLLQVVKDVASNYVVVGSRRAKKKGEEVKPLVIPDYISGRIIVKTSDERGRLRKIDLLTALDLWYFIGGNLVLTTNALSTPPPWSGLPIEMEVSDVIIEESINMFMKELREARENSEWWRTRQLRRILYEQLRAYIQNFEESERKMGRTRFMKSGLITSNSSTLDVYSFVERKRL